MTTTHRLHPRRGARSRRSRFDTRTAMVAISASGAVPLLAIALMSPTFLRPDALPALIVVLTFTAVTVVFASVVGRLTETQFIVLGFGGMAGVAVSAYLIADPGGMRAVTSMLAVVPAIAASGSPPRVTTLLTVSSVSMGTVLSVAGLASSGWAVTAVAVGAAVTSVVVPVALITALRRTLKVTNNQLEMLAYTDPLTGLLNRRGLLTHAPTLFDTAADQHERVSALVVDIDLFKTVNDTCGHTAGDQTLASVAHALTRAAHDDRAPGAVVARTGGEEFLIIAFQQPGTNLTERILEQVRADCTVTVSIGSVTVDLQPPRAPAATGPQSSPRTGARSVDAALDEIVHTADTALYEAKRSGRNRACHAGHLTLIWPTTGTHHPDRGG